MMGVAQTCGFRGTPAASCSAMERPWTAPNPMGNLWTALRAPGLRPCPQVPHRAPLAHRPFGPAHSLPTASAYGWKPLRGSHSRLAAL